jgi:hypothetical protein
MTIPIYSGDVPYPKKDCVLQALRRTWASSTWPTSAFLPPSVPSQPWHFRSSPSLLRARFSVCAKGVDM